MGKSTPLLCSVTNFFLLLFQPPPSSLTNLPCPPPPPSRSRKNKLGPPPPSSEGGPGKGVSEDVFSRRFEKGTWDVGRSNSAAFQSRAKPREDFYFLTPIPNKISTGFLKNFNKTWSSSFLVSNIGGRTRACVGEKIRKFASRPLLPPPFLLKAQLFFLPPPENMCLFLVLIFSSLLCPFVEICQRNAYIYCI